MPQAELRLKYEKASSDDAAKEAWTKDFEASASQVRFQLDRQDVDFRQAQRTMVDQLLQKGQMLQQIQTSRFITGAERIDVAKIRSFGEPLFRHLKQAFPSLSYWAGGEEPIDSDEVLFASASGSSISRSLSRWMCRALNFWRLWGLRIFGF